MTPTGTAGAPSLSLTVDASTNRVSGPGNVYWDANGNLEGTALWALAYDVANRVVLAHYSNTYRYDSDNRRIYYRAASGVETVYVYGASGEKLAAYTVGGVSNNVIQLTLQSQNVYFAGRLISAEGNAVGVDRLGSVRWGAYGTGTPNDRTYYPYGVEYSATGNDTEKYATYTRDSLTGLDYAVNRYYATIWGRFTSPDPSTASVSLSSPQSWNRYGYVMNDPINYVDPDGRNRVLADCEWIDVGDDSEGGPIYTEACGLAFWSRGDGGGSGGNGPKWGPKINPQEWFGAGFDEAWFTLSTASSDCLGDIGGATATHGSSIHARDYGLHSRDRKFVEPQC